MAEGSQEPLIRLHPQIPRAPDVAHAGVVRENGVVRSEIADRGRDHLRAQPLATSLAIDVRLDPVDGLDMSLECRVQKRSIKALGQPRQQTAKCVADVPDQPKIDVVEIAQKRGAPKTVDTDEFIRADTTLEILATD